MGLDALKQEAAALDEASRRELLTYLISLREQQWAAQANEMSRRLDDPSSDRWLTMEEFETRLNRIAEPPAE